MELFDRIKAGVGIGAPILEFEGVADTLRAGEVVRGTLVLNGGDGEVPIRHVALHVDEQLLTYTTPTGVAAPERQTQRSVASVEIDLGGQPLRSGERVTRSFELALPEGLQPTAGPLCYALVAEAEIVGLNPRVEQALTVVA